MPTNNSWNSNLPAEVAKGGTGATTLTDHGVLVGSATSPIDALSVGTNGQLLIGSTGTDPAFATVTSTVGTIGFTTGAASLALDVNAGLQITSGFATWTGAGNYFDDTTLGDFTILRGGTGYVNSKPVTWAAPQTISGLVAGNTYYIYVDNTGTIGKTTTFSASLYQDNIVLFECLRDSTLVNNQITVKENHPFGFPIQSSDYLHEVLGTVIENMTNGANITLNGTQKIQINGADVLADHGLETTIPDSGGVGVTWRKMYTDAGGKWATQNNTDTFGGFYNNAGTVTALGANKFGVYTLYVSKDTLTAVTPTYFAVLDSAQYNNLSVAQSAIASGATSRSSNELAQLELAQLGYIIYDQGSNSIVQVTVSKSTIRQTLSSTGTNVASLVNTVVTNFNNVLSSADTNVQSALDTLDDFGSGTGNQTVNLYTGAAVKTVTLGSTNTTSATTVQSGSTGLTITSATANGPISIVSGTGTIGIATSATNSAVNVGTGAGAKVVTVGSTNGASSLALKYGTADFSLASATGNVMVAQDTGEVTKPLQPAFLAFLGSVDNNVTGNGTIYTLGTNVALTEVFDQNSDFNTNGTFTAPVTGKYNLGCFLNLQGCTIASAFQVRIATSNRTYYVFYTRTASSLPQNLFACCLADMDSADTCTFQVYSFGEAADTNDLDGNASALVTYVYGSLIC